MAGVHLRIIAKREQDRANRANERGVVAAGQIRSTDRSRKQGIPDEQMLAGRRTTPDLQAHATGTMAGCMVWAHIVLAKSNHLIQRVELVDGRLRLHRQAEHRAVLDGVLVQEQVVAMQVNRHAKRPLCIGDTSHVIDVGVREQDVADGESMALGKRQQLINLVAGVDEHRLASRLAGHDEAVLEERAHGTSLNYHNEVILAIVDDLMFASKIKTTAGPLEVAVTFARSRDAALAEMRQRAPALVIFDLNSARTDPLGIVAAMKDDPTLAAIPTIGFVSHVRSDVIDAARKAGVGEILQRSAFTARLAEILARGR